MAWFVSSEYRDRDRGNYQAPDITRIPREHQRFEADGKALADTIQRHWCRIGRPFDSAEFPHFGTTLVPPLTAGWRWPLASEPYRDIIVDDDRELVDIVGSSFGTYAISQRVIDAIEAIEPGVHQYLPYELLRQDGSVYPERRWLLNMCTRAEVLDVGASNVAWWPSDKPRLFGDITIGGKRRHVVARASAAAGRALWWEWRYATARSFMVSDVLYEALQAIGVRGWQPHVSYPDHVDEV